MSEQSGTTATEGQGAGEHPGSGERTHHGPRLSLHAIGAALCDVRQQAEDAVMEILPPAVTEHLINSQREVVLAGRRLADIALERLDEKAARARK